MADILSAILVSGVVLGSGYALMASGLSLVWSTLGIFNFAHGVLMTLGAYVAWTVTDRCGGASFRTGHRESLFQQLPWSAPAF